MAVVVVLVGALTGRTASVTSACSTGAPSERSVRWIRNLLDLPGTSGSYSKNYSMRSVNSVRENVSGSFAASGGWGERHAASTAVARAITRRDRRPTVVGATVRARHQPSMGRRYRRNWNRDSIAA